MSTTPVPVRQAYLALAAICILWGTTYTAIKLAVRDFPPFLLVGMRQTTAGLILLLWAYARGKIHPALLRRPGAVLPVDQAPEEAPPLDRNYVFRQAITGIATITGGNGFITWGMQYVSSGVSAVIGSLTPVVVVLINLAWRGTERLNALIISGVLLGFAGLGLIFREGWSDFANPNYAWGIAGCFGSCFTWSLGTVMSKRFNDPRVSPILNAGIQITAGGIGGFFISLLFDTSYTIHHSWEGWLSLAYLIIFGSALAFSLYMFALKHLSATVSSLYTYINPVVAILLGWLLLGEHLNSWEVAGMAITIGGVWLVNRGS